MASATPRVTVIMATWNWCEVLPFSIGSALLQTFGDFELLVVGDGCTDQSERVVAAVGDPRVRWINLPRNTGHQSAPNEGLRQARGQLRRDLCLAALAYATPRRDRSGLRHEG